MSEKIDVKDLNTIKTIFQVILILIGFSIFLYYSEDIIGCFSGRCSSSEKTPTITFFISLLILLGGFNFLQKSKK